MNIKAELIKAELIKAELIKEIAKHTDASAERKKKVFYMIRRKEIHSVEEVKRLLTNYSQLTEILGA